MKYDRGTFHVPRIEHGSDDTSIPVVFLKRTTQEHVARFIEKLGDFDKTTKQATGLPDSLPTIQAHRWLRDGRARPQALMIYMERLRAHFKKLRCCVLIDPAPGTQTCAISTWSTLTGDEENMEIDTVNIDIKSALPVLALLEHDHRKTLRSILGDQYDEAKVDLIGTLPKPGPELVDDPYEPSEELLNALSNSNDKAIKIFCTQDSGFESLDGLMDSIRSHQTAEDPDVQLIKWRESPATRAELCKLVEWLNRETSLNTDVGYTFCIDPLMRREGGGPKFMAASIARTLRGFSGFRGIDLVPIKQPKDLFELYAAGLNRVRNGDRYGAERKIATWDAEQKLCRTNEREIVRNPNRIIFNERVEGESTTGTPTVWYLRPFNEDEERQIRKRLFEPQYSDVDEGFDMMFMGYILPNEGIGRTHTIEDLVTFWQKCDPVSPFFDPGCSSFRMDNYPHNFIVVDDRILSDESPKVTMASTLDWYHPTEVKGWQYGTMDASHASLSFCNLDLGNMGPCELVDDEKLTRLWLDDVNEMRIHPDEEDEEDI